MTMAWKCCAAEAIILAAERYNGSDPVNLGSAFEISVKDPIETIVRLTDFQGETRLTSGTC